ncbi:related to cathepsin d (lysosomal aspartyl protease) [Sporisorium reilianum SRZ2]|uniref:Related to cathepsin d (Lysosomal aspartyl protease) n=1 Tax=Sporisorium reilianum (strain SRZ2) TaxID=999809 RepID=E7A055_SPORE|nr:related to cathepsin d (lysosomal aspartyl protease) [Sporisorium reilianum SRZ2]
MTFQALLSTVTAALVCASTVQSYVLPFQANPEQAGGDLAAAQAFRLAGRSLNDLADGSISVPVYKRHGALHPDMSKRDPDTTRQWALRQAEVMKSKFGAANANQKRQTIGLTDVGPDSYYFAQVSVGTPAQNFNVVLDTGSADFWLVDTDCGTSSGCDSNLNKYSTSASSTNIGSTTPFSITYGTGAVRGVLAADKVSLAGYMVSNLTFAEANAVAANTVEYPTSGIMGMGFQSLSTSGATPFWQVLAKQNVLQSNAFTFQLARNIDNINPNNPNINDVQSPGGVFTLGKIDTNQYTGDITYTSIPNNLQNQQGLGYWTIPLGGITVNGNAANIGSNPLVAIDTGTTLIGGPASAISAFYAQISGSRSARSAGMPGYYLFPCSANLNIQLSFGGKSWAMNAQDFNLGSYPYTNSQTCLGALFEIDLGSTQYGVPQWIVGDSFLKNVFSVFDGAGRVGFASLKGSEAQIVSVTSNAVSSQTPQPTSSGASSSASMGGGLPFPTASSYASQATASGVFGGGSLPVPSASSAVATSNPSLTAGQSSSGSSGSGSGSSGSGGSGGSGSSSGSSSGAGSLLPNAVVGVSAASAAALLAGALLVL